MSLFGSSPDDSGLAKSSTRQQSKSLFEDEGRPTSNTNNSLFADDNSNESPWSIPTPKRTGRSELIKNLIPPPDAPETYIDAFDTILESEESTNGRVSSIAVTKLLQSSGIPSSEQERLLSILSSGSVVAEGLERNTFNVLLALIGLAQEGDEATLDGVDERKKSVTFSCN